MSEDDELKAELEAARRWIQILTDWIFDPEGHAELAEALIQEWKNAPPRENWNPARYDAMLLRRLPHLERIGRQIVEDLRSRGHVEGPDQT